MFGHAVHRIPVAQVQEKFRTSIAGVRAFAIISVVIFHIDAELLPGGFIGVDIFFVLSGYLIIGLVWQEVSKTGRVDWTGFYARRVRRLFPASIFLVVSVTVIGLVLLPFWQWDYLLWQAASGVGFFANILFAQQPGGYFAESVNSPEPLLHMWTLSLEEQFYFIVPIILALLVYYSRVNTRRKLIILLVVITFTSFMLSILLSPLWERTSFYLIHARAWEFTIGGLAAVVLSSMNGVSQVIRGRPGEFLSIAGLSILILSIFVITSEMTWPGWWTVLPVVGTLLILMADDQALPNRLISIKPMVSIGAISYSWYLWHYPPIVLINKTWLPSLELWYLTVAAIGILGALVSFFCVEQIFRGIPMRDSLRASKMVLGGIGAIIVLVTALGIGAKMNEIYKTEVTADRQKPIIQAENPTESNESLDPRHESSLDPLERNNGESLDSAVSDQTPEPEKSLKGMTVLMVGDSHSLHWESAMRSVVEDELEGELRMHSLLSCPAIDVYVTKLDGSPMRTGCREHRQSFWGKAETADIILLSQAEHYIDRIRAVDGEALGPEKRLILWENEYKHWLQRASELDVIIGIIGDNPIMPGNPAQCAQYSEDIASCDASKKDVLIRMGGLPESSISARNQVLENPSRQVWSAFDEICRDDTCVAVDQGIVVFTDNQHLSMDWTMSRVEKLERWLLGLVNG
jgi:peptidoglycan/LPS O-acetylase OafA/YrhL